ncbi:uncharacterized protein LOC120170069 [Hibiscus syriacus]|uniref:uncharacterized protein LOC120170069 n=1 Tax=Hibiscus syriacus TaxID=106335 RepID=UPI0019209D97|nr:uncharacterized protein LOC120170069 [Hibiscus syriacus]
MPTVMIGWIKSCVTTPSFSISLNGGLVGYFKGAKGIRQCDPLSPYMFVITMNVLSKMFDKAAEFGVIQYNPKCHRVKLTNLCFADDLLVFSKGTAASILGVWEVLKVFHSFSRLQLNVGKSEIFFSGMDGSMQSEVCDVTGIKSGKLPVRDCGPLVEKIASRLQGWQARVLSYAGSYRKVKISQ